jgi:hypothetical protein
VVLVEGRKGLMIKSEKTKKRIAWGKVLKQIKKHGHILDYRLCPMVLKRSFLNKPFIHTANRDKVRYSALRKVKGE